MALIVFSATPGMSATGKLVIKPYVDLEFRCDSNYTASDVNERSVVSYGISPGMAFAYVTAKSRVLARGTVTGTGYTDRDMDFVGHDLSISAETQLTDRLSVGVEELFRRTRDPGGLDEYSNDFTREKYTVNQLSSRLFYQFGERFGLGLTYRNERYDYSGAALEDSTGNRGSVNLKYTLDRLSFLDLEGRAWNRDYDGATPDYTSRQIMINYSREFMVFTVTMGVGYHDRHFDDTSLEDLDAVVWKVEVSGQNPPEAELEQEIKSHLRVGLSRNLNDLGMGWNYCTATRLDMEAGRLFLDRFNVTVGGFFQNSVYEDDPSGREDNAWLVSGRVDYKISPRFTVGLEAGHETRNSNIPDFEFDNTYVLVSVRVELDATPGL